MELEGQAELMRELERIISEIGSGNVEIGFGGDYPDGGPSVPAVASLEMNSESPAITSRPAHFRNMIAQNQGLMD